MALEWGSIFFRCPHCKSADTRQLEGDTHIRTCRKCWQKYSSNHERGLPMARKSRFKESDIKGMVKEYRSGSTVRDIAVAWDCSTPTVIKLLHDGGIKKLRTKGRRAKHNYSKPTTRTKHDIAYQKLLRQREKAREEKNAKDRARRKKTTKVKSKKRAA